MGQFEVLWCVKPCMKSWTPWDTEIDVSFSDIPLKYFTGAASCELVLYLCLCYFVSSLSLKLPSSFSVKLKKSRWESAVKVLQILNCLILSNGSIWSSVMREDLHEELNTYHWIQKLTYFYSPLNYFTRWVSCGLVCYLFVFVPLSSFAA